MKKYFITGGSGFLGTHLIRALNKYKNVKVIAPSSKEINLLNYNHLKNISEKFDEIFHLAAWTQAGDFCIHNPGKQWIINQQINTNIIAWWQKYQARARLVFIGTSCCYNESEKLNEDKYLNSVPHESLYTYAMTKKMLLAGAIACEKQFNLSWFSPIPSTLYGPDYHLDGRQSHFIFDLIKKILKGKYKNKEVKLWGDGNQKREIIHVKDFVKYMLKAKKVLKNDIINIGSSKDYSIKEFAHKICDLLDYDQKKIIFDQSKYTGAKSKKLDISKIKLLFPDYEKKLIKLEDGLKQTIEWYFEHNRYLR